MNRDPHNPRNRSEWPTQWTHNSKRPPKVRRHIVNVHPSNSPFCSCGWNGAPRSDRILAWEDAIAHQAKS